MALTYDFEKSVWFWMAQTVRELETTLNRELAPEGITLRQAQVLGQLAHGGERSQVELAEDLGIEPSTLVRVLDRMERDGWVERHASPADRRKKLIRVTAKAEPAWQRIIQQGESIERRALEGLSAVDEDTLRRMLARIFANMSGRGDTATTAEVFRGG